MRHNAIVTKCKCDKIQIEQNAKIPRYQHDKMQKDKKQRGQNPKI